MDPVDILTVAMHAAQLIRSGNDPAKAIVGAYEALRLQRPDDGDDPLAVRIARLADAAGAQRDALIQFLNKQAGPLPLNRPPKGWGGAVEPAAAEEEETESEAEELVTYTEVEEESAREMMDNFPAFSVAQKRIESSFGGRTLIVRKGKGLTLEQAG